MHHLNRQTQAQTPQNGKSVRGRRSRRILLGFSLAAGLFALVAAGCASAGALFFRSNFRKGGYLESWDEKDGRVLSSLSYGEKRTDKYDLYLPAGVKPDSETPLLLMIHGGSWTTGQREDVAYACKYYAKKGCITATMDYSLVSDNHPEITIKTMLDEITACTAALKKQLEKEGYRVSGMAIGGYSAGAHLALLYAYSRAADSAFPIAFVFEKVGPVSFRREFWDERTSAALIGYGAGIPADPKKLDTPELIEAADALSPLHFVREGVPPTIFAYGGKDTLVRPVHRIELAKALEEHHVPNRCIEFPNSNHMLWNDPDSTEEFREAVLRYCRQYLKLPADTEANGPSASRSGGSDTDVKPVEEP